MAGALQHSVWMLSVIIMTSCDTNTQCSSPYPADVHFTISSSRNHTGHWNALVHLNHENFPRGNEQLETGSWEVDIKQTVTKCDERERIGIVASLTAPPARAAPGYELVPGFGYYKLHTKTKTWLQARQTCNDEGAHLAIVNSDKELKVLQRIFQLHPKIVDGWVNNCAYLGFHDMFVEKQFLTVFGDPLDKTGYSKFAAGEPSDKTEVENCGCFCRSKELADVGCENNMPFVCEQEII